MPKNLKRNIRIIVSNGLCDFLFSIPFSLELDAAQSKVEGWKNDIDQYRKRLKQRADEIKKEKENLKKLCDNECGYGKGGIG